MNDEKDYLECNRRSWDARLPMHLGSAFYDVEGWKSSGRISLTDIERREVGEVKGKSLLHLQCHFGQDTPLMGAPGSKGMRMRLLCSGH